MHNFSLESGSYILRLVTQTLHFIEGKKKNEVGISMQVGEEAETASILSMVDARADQGLVVSEVRGGRCAIWSKNTSDADERIGRGTYEENEKGERKKGPGKVHHCRCWCCSVLD